MKPGSILRINGRGGGQTWFTAENWLDYRRPFSNPVLEKGDLTIALEYVYETYESGYFIWIVCLSRYGLGVIGAYTDSVGWEDL